MVAEAATGVVSGMSVAKHILIFARYPVPGGAKTRLIPALGADGAALLHRRMTEHVVAIAREAGAGGDTAVTVCFTGGSRSNFRAWLGTDLLLRKQPAGDLGIRLRRAFESAFRSGTERVLAVGSDVPGISSGLLRQALRALDDRDIVLGPAADGGYYLLGMKQLHSELFMGINWGTERVCAQTRGAITDLGLSATELPLLNDIDRSRDLDSLRDDGRFADVLTGQPKLSVIIPTLNEATTIGRTLDTVLRAECVEVIVSDGGSRDATRETAAVAGAKVAEVSGGRAAQQNAGADEAKGRYLLFLHADTLLPTGYFEMIHRALNDPATVAGAFRFRTNAPGPAMRVIEWGANVRSTVFQWPYGDQGLFMEKRMFNELGGFAPLPIMEDFDLIRRLRRRGRIATLPAEVVTSARRWRRLGAFSTTLLNQAMVVGFLAGIEPGLLARFYRHREKQKK